MKKYLSIFLLLLISVASKSQTTVDTLLSIKNGHPGVMHLDTTRHLPMTPGLYFNGYGDFVNLSDSVSGLFWNLGGNTGLNTPDTSRYLGTNNPTPLLIKTNGITRIKLDSVTGTTTFKGTPFSDVAVQGSELTTTGSGTNWTGSGFSTGYTHTTGATTALSTSTAAVLNHYYVIVITITGSTGGTINTTYGGYSTGNITFNNGTPFYVSLKASTTATLTINPQTNFDGNVVISLKEVTGSSSSLLSLQNSAGTVTNSIRSTVAISNNLFGYLAGGYIVYGTDNTANGSNSLKFNISGYNNSALGSSSLYNNINGNYNTASGAYSMYNTTTGSNNTASGSNSLYSNTTGGFNTATGSSSLYNNTTASSNTANGFNSLYTNSTGTENCAFGYGSMNLNTSGNYNAAIGSNSVRANTTGANNAGVGSGSLQNNTTGSNNVAAGYYAGRYIADGTTSATILNSSVLIGANTKPLADNQTNQIVIGNAAVGLGSNTTVLGNSSTLASKVYGIVADGYGANVASASAIVPTGNTFHVTGTTTITSITATNVNAGAIITIIFDGILTFTDGSNLKLAGNFTTAADATITLRYDGTNFYEMSRSTN